MEQQAGQKRRPMKTQQNEQPQSPSGAVTSEHHAASLIGAQTMAKGGNAVDAAIATTLAVGALCPYHSCIGGGGFAIVRTKEGEFETIDFRSRAPAAITMEHYESHATSNRGLAVAVPGEIKGFAALHTKYGRLPWAELFQPSIDIARGTEVGKDLYDFLSRECPNAPSIDGSWLASDPEFVRTFTSDDKLLPVGATWSRPEYAAALEAVALEGPSVYYDGWIGQKVIAAIQANGGEMTMQDLRDYEPHWRPAIKTTYGGVLEVHSVPAPASGSTLLAALNALGHKGLEGEHEGPTSERDAHCTLEAMRLAYGARAQLGDPAFVPGIEELQASWIREEGGRQWAAKIGEETREPGYYLSTAPAEDSGTSAIAAADSSGLVVSLTTTIGTAWASRIFVPGTGIVLNDSMDDFSLASRPNVWGYAPAPPNYVHASKRPLSSMCPYIVTDTTNDDMPILAGGAAGGSTIPSANIQVIRNVINYGMSADDALAFPLLHNQVLPNITLLEKPSVRGREIKAFDPAIAPGLEKRGHRVEWIERSRSTPCVLQIIPNGPLPWEYDPAGDARKFDAAGAVYWDGTAGNC